MSYYYEKPFKSADPVIAKVKLELRSYFDTGAVDDSLFPIYINGEVIWVVCIACSL